MRRYITTAIDYPNAAPHMGHVLEKVLADVVARWFRLRGDDVRFQIGTDEHGIKIQQTAAKQGVTPSQLVDQNVPLFTELYAKLGISADRFIRTSDHPVAWPQEPSVDHKATVQALWKKLRDAKALEKRAYTGLYCSGCERFVTKKDLVDGLCPDHKIAPQEVTEENWFFLLSRERDWLKELLTKNEGGYRIEPSFRANETLALLDGGLEDVSFSRPVSSLSWGIPVPDEEGQTMYVWCDALTNYVSGLGCFTDHEEMQWWNDAEVTHVIGKDIARFHALIWPAMLTAAKLRTPDRLLIHGFVTSEGQKMSKSLGNVVDPQEVIAKYGVDALRFFLSSEIPVGNDGDFSWKRFGEIYQAKLGNQLGNLLNRVLVMLQKTGGSLEMKNQAMELSGFWNKYAVPFQTCSLDAIHVPMEIVTLCNGRFNELKPWSLEPVPQLDALSGFAEILRHTALMLLPFIPETAQKMSRQLGVPYAEQMLDKNFVLTDALKSWGGCPEWKRVGEPSILFPKVE